MTESIYTVESIQQSFTQAEYDVLVHVAKDKPLPKVKSAHGNFETLTQEHDKALTDLKKRGFVRIIIGTSYHDLTASGFEVCRSLRILDY